jgi:hypothetical protein
MGINHVYENEFLLPDEVALLLRKPNKKALAVDRCLRRDHPPYLKLGRRILYRRADVLAWLEAHIVNPGTSRWAMRNNAAVREPSGPADGAMRTNATPRLVDADRKRARERRKNSWEK